MSRMDSTRQLAILHTVARKLSSSVHLEQILQLTLAQVAELLQLETGWIFLLNEEDQFYLAASQNLPAGLQAEPERLSGWCYCLDMFRDDQLHSAQNISVIACSRLSALQKQGEQATGGLRFHASIPLQTGEQKLGVLNVASLQRQQLNQDELHILYTIGDLLSLAIQRTRFYEEHLNHSTLNERYRMARELHDSLGQGLAALILRLETLDALVDKMQAQELEPAQAVDRLKPQISQSVALARKTLREARSSVQDLRSPELHQPDLQSALEQLVQELLGSQAVVLALPSELRFSPGLQHSLWRMLQELVTNIHKHAQAQQVRIALETSAEGICLKVSDDGQGFTPAAIAPGHFGLLGLRERVNLLQGRLSICSCPGQGTQIEIQLPLEGSL